MALRVEGTILELNCMNQILDDAQVLFTFLSDTEEASGPVDIVLAMGSQDLNVPVTAARAFQKRQAQWLVCSGGFGKDTAALFHEPEAVLFAKRCVELGVPEARVLIEDQAANSGENFRFSRALLEARGITPRTGVIAAKPYMAKRALATAVMQWPEVRWSAARSRVDFYGYLDQGNDLGVVLDLMVGDLQRLRVYAGRFQTPVEVPEAVWAAYQRLAGAGYDRYVIREI